MTQSRLLLGVAGFLVVAALTGCQIGEKAIVDKQELLNDGERLSWKLDPGTYQVELTATGDGASVTWAGSVCPGSDETKSYSATCELKNIGHITIANPTVLGTGQPTSIALKITKLAQAAKG